MRKLMHLYRIPDYRRYLEFVSEQQYLEEWKSFLSSAAAPLPPSGERVFDVSKFSQLYANPAEAIERTAASLLEVVKQNHTTSTSGWTRLLIEQIVTTLRNTFHSIAVLEFIKVHIQSHAMALSFFPLLDPIHNDNCVARLAWYHQQLESMNIDGAPVLSEAMHYLLKEESKKLYSFVTTCSDEIRNVVKNGFVKKGYWQSPSYCHEEAMKWFKVPIYKHLWHLLYATEATACDRSFKRSFLTLLSLPNNSILFEALCLPRCCDLVIERMQKSPVEDDIGSQFQRELMALLEMLETGSITIEMLDFLTVQATRLQQLTRKNIPEIIDSKRETIKEAKSQWELLLSSLRLMQDCPPFHLLSNKKLGEYETNYTLLEQRPIRDWTPPQELDLQLQLLCERLAKLKKLHVFSYLWDQKESKDPTMIIAEETLFDEWMTYIERNDQEFKAIVTRFSDKTITTEVVAAIYRQDFYKMVLQPMEIRMQLPEVNNVQLRGEYRRSLDTFEQFLLKEVQEASILARVPMDEAIVRLIRDGMHALTIQKDAKALAGIADSFQLKGEAIQRNQLFAASDDQQTIEAFVASYYSTVALLPQLQESLPRFFVLFREVFLQQGLLPLLLSFPDIATFNRRIDAKQSEDLTDEIGELLTALRSIGQILLLHPLCPEFRRSGAVIETNPCLDLIYSCHDAMRAMSYLNGKVTAAEAALQQATEEKQIIAIVKSLLFTGSFIIEIKQRKVICFGCQSDKSEISPEEFEALPSQLLLTSGVELRSDRTDQVDEPLPANISRPEDRERYVHRFIVLFDRTIALSKVIQSLCESGCPDYQENRLTIPCTIPVKELDAKMEEMQQILDVWMHENRTMRLRFPGINCFSRVQLVEWMRAICCEPVDINVLHDTLVAVGCPAGSLVTEKIEAVVKDFQSDGQVHSVVATLDVCFRDCFSIDKLVAMPVPQARGNIAIYQQQQKLSDSAGSEATATSLVRLVRLIGEASEEEVVGLHLGQHKRVPFPFELLFCSEDTTEIDAEDFVERWARFHQIIPSSKDHVASFYLVHPNRLGFEKQYRLVRKIAELQKELQVHHPEYAIPLFLVVETEGLSCYLTNAYQKQEVIVNQEDCRQARANIALCLKQRQVYVVTTPSCSSGKTRAIVSQLVDPQKHPNRLHAQVTIDKSPLNASLIRLGRERPLKDPEGIVLHFNIGHAVNVSAVNVFLLEYILLGTWKDGKGASFPRHPKDVIVIELCNTGYEDERQRIRITQHFTVLPVDPMISPVVYRPIPSERHGSIELFLENPHGEKIAAAVQLGPIPARWFSADTDQPLDISQPLIILLDPYQTLKACYSHEEDGRYPPMVTVDWLRSDGYASSGNAAELHGFYAMRRETMLYHYDWQPSDRRGPSLLYHLYQIQTGVVDQIVPYSAVEQLPVPSPAELDLAVKSLSEYQEVAREIRETYLRRFYQFTSTQLNNFYSSFRDFWSIAEVVDEGGEEQDYLFTLTYEYAMMLLLNCRDLAKPMMLPQQIASPKDDIARFQDMASFREWMNRPYFICTPTSFQVLSTAQFDPLQYIIQKHPRTDFAQWLQLYASLRPYNRQRVQNLCDQLARCPYQADSEKPPLRDLMEIVGCYEGAREITQAVDYLNTKKTPGTAPIHEEYENLFQAVSWLNAKTTNPLESLTEEDPISKFKQVAEAFLCRIFGEDPHKPGFRLTVGSVLRLIAIQIRNICHIPICILGETGCGKTEMLSFLAKLIGAHYHVINVQEGMEETIFRERLQRVIQEAVLHPDLSITCVLDEANATSHVWLAKDLLCDHLLQGIRLPANINFVVIMNPAKHKSPEYLAIEKEMSVGGLDFRKYQHITDSDNSNRAKMIVGETNSTSKDLVYQVNAAPETLYSLMWDFGSSHQVTSERGELPEVVRLMVLDPYQEQCSDELQLALSMVDWLVARLKNDSQDLLDTFASFGDAADGDAYFWQPFRTIVVELILASQNHIRRAYGGETSSISLRDIRNTCTTVLVIFSDFFRAAVELKPDLLTAYGKSATFYFLTASLHVSLVVVYCLRLDTSRRLKYLQEIHSQWQRVRDRFPRLEPTFLPAPPPDPSTSEMSDLYRSFDDLALLVVSDLFNDGEIAPNQALKENTFAMLLAIWMKSTLFIVGRPGSTKSRSLELLCDASVVGEKKRSFIAVLGLVIHKFVVQCSPDTTAEHVNAQARRAAIAQHKQLSQLTTGETRHQCVLVLEEVGATIGSRHNPLMSLHQLIDHGVQCQTQTGWIRERIPVLGISNYRLDASKMGRGSIVHRGNPVVEDLALTARTILRHLDRTGSTDYTKMFSQAFNHNILQDQTFNWYHGMRDFYGSVSTIQRLLQPVVEYVGLKKRSNNSTPSNHRRLTAHIARWTMLINLQGYPNTTDEARLLKTMIDSFQLPSDTPAVWQWHDHPHHSGSNATAFTSSSGSMKLCDACCRMKLYLKLAQHRTENPQAIIDTDTVTSIFQKHATAMRARELPCEFFHDQSLPALEIIAYSLWETSTRHQMIFTKANAALPLLFSLRLLRKEDCTIIFHSMDGNSGNTSSQAVTTSERVQQMMRIKACLREGKTLILVRSRHLYESLLDATNVHYIRDYSGDGEAMHRTMLSMAGVTQSVLVRPSFRCVVLEDRDELRDYVMPPFINRFAKTTLTYASILSPSQRLVRNFLINQSQVTLGGENGDMIFHLFQALAPGSNNFTMDSAAFTYDGEQEAFERMANCFSRKNLRRLRLGLVEFLGKNRDIEAELVKLETRWKEAGANQPFRDRAVQLLEASDDVIETEEVEQEEIEEVVESEEDWEAVNEGEAEVEQDDGMEAEHDNEEAVEEEEDEGNEEVKKGKLSHLMIMTEQHRIVERDLVTVLSEIICNVDRTTTCRFVPAEVQLLNQMTAANVSRTLSELRREPRVSSSTANTSSESQIAVFVLDSETPSPTSLDTFLYLVSTADGIGIDSKRVVLIVNYRDSLIVGGGAESKFHFVFHRSWTMVNVDEIVSKSLVGPLLPEESLDRLENEELYLHDLLTEAFFYRLLLPSDVLLRLCQSLSNPIDVPRKMDILERLLRNPSELRSAIYRICRRSMAREQISFQRWATCAFRKGKRGNDSLRSIYLSYLTEFVAQVIFVACDVLFRFGTIYCLDRDESLNGLTAGLLELFLPMFDVSHCLQVEAIHKPMSSDLSSGLLQFSKRIEVTFPFSPQLAVLFSQQGDTTNSMTEEILRLFITLGNGIDSEVKQQWTQSYLRDILLQGLSINSDSLELFMRLITFQSPAAFDSIEEFHRLLKVEKSRFSAAKRFLDAGLEPLAVETFLCTINPTSRDVMALAKNMQGVPVLARVELLRVLLREDPDIPWRLYRAAGMAVQLYLEDGEALGRFQQCMTQFETGGIVAGLEYSLSHFPEAAKFFLFEWFGGNDSKAMEDLESLSLAMQYFARPEIQLEEDAVKRCLGFLLSKVFVLYFRDFGVGMLRESLEQCAASPRHALFVSHCLINLLSSDIDLTSACFESCERMNESSPLKRLLQSCVAIVCIWRLLTEEIESEQDNKEEEEEEDNDLDSLSQWLEVIFKENPSLSRHLVLYAIRQLSANGTVDIESALIRIKAHPALPTLMKAHPLLIEVTSALQKESPLTAIPQYSAAIVALSEITLGPRGLLQGVSSLAHFSAVASLISGVATKEMPAFAAVKDQEINRYPENKVLLSRLESVKRTIPNFPTTTEAQELLIHGWYLLASHQSHAAVVLRSLRQAITNKVQLNVYRKEIEESLVPHCPRCKGAIGDWDGCFAVMCECGCGFCGVCLIDCGTDAHEHVMQTHGNYHFPFERFLQEFGALASQRIRGIIGNAPLALQVLLRDELPRILEGNRYNIRPEAVLQAMQPAIQARQRGGEDVRILSASTRYLFDVLTTVAHAYLRLQNERDNENDDDSDLLSWQQISEGLETSMENLRQSLFPDADNIVSAARWLHAGFSELLAQNPAQTVFASVLEAQHHFEGLVGNAAPDQLLQRLLQRMARPSSQILEELSFSNQEIREDYFAAIFLHRTNYYPEQFIEHLRVNSSQYPLLYTLEARSESLRKSNVLANLRLVHFLRDLSAFVQSQQLSRDEAERTPLHRVIDQHPSLVNRKDDFVKDFQQIFQQIRRYECNLVIYEQFKHLLEPGALLSDQTSVALFLPRKEGVGILARALYHGRGGDTIRDWTGLGNLQNEIVEVAQRGISHLINTKDSQSSVLSPYEIQEDDLITCEMSVYLRLLYHLFLLPDYRPRLCNDLWMMETMLRFGSLRLVFYSKLQPELQDHQYPLDSFSTLLEPLETMLAQYRKDFLPLPAVLHTALTTLLQHAPNAVTLIFEFAVLAIKQLTTFNFLLPEFVRDIRFTIPMTRDQAEGQQILFQIPVIRSELRVVHLRSLLAICWDATVHASAAVALSAGERERPDFSRGFRYLVDHPEHHHVVPFLLTELRVLGMAQCQQTLPTGLAETPIFDMLSGEVQDQLEASCEALGGALPPLTYPLKHFLAVYESAREMLGPLEAVQGEDIADNEREVLVVSNSIIRQFLTPSHSDPPTTSEEAKSVAGDKARLPKQPVRGGASSVNYLPVIAAIESKQREPEDDHASEESIQSSAQKKQEMMWSKTIGLFRF